MTEKIIAYRFPNWMDTKFIPVYERKPGTIATAAMMCCDECGICMSPMGGGGQYLCPECFHKFKLVNFTQGNDPV